ncbi:hypothetical protein BGX28_002384, partial [Mortierella sp. GBA30]
LVFVNRYTIRLQGILIPHGDERRGYPVESQYNKRTQGTKKHIGLGYVWSAELEHWPSLDYGDFDQAATDSTQLVKRKAEALKAYKKTPDFDPRILGIQEQELAILRRHSYYWCKLEKAAKKHEDGQELTTNPPTATK